MESHIKSAKSSRRSSKRILGMTLSQITILSVLGCFAITLLGVFVTLVLSNSNPLQDIQLAAPISSPTNPPPTPTPRPINQVRGCNPSDVDAWINQTTPRLEAIDSDMEYLNLNPPNSFADFRPYAQSARQRYVAQWYQKTPACLEDLQKIALEELRLFWKGLEAAANGDSDGLRDNLTRLVEISIQFDQALQEIEQNK